MPLGSNKIGFIKNKQLGSGGTGIPVDNTTTITSSFSGNTATRLINVTGADTLDATIVTFNVDSNYANVTMEYSLSNCTTSDFADSAITGSFTTDENGNGSVSKTITSSGGHVANIVFTALRPGSNVVISNSNPVNIYEVTPITMSGGDTTTTSNVANPQYSADGNVFFSTRIHTFTTPGNATLTITDYGNYEGNANIWLSQYLTTESVGASNSEGSYWQEGLDIRSLVIGGGGDGGAGAGAGEFGILRYPFANVSTGTYTMTVGAVEGNSHVFRGNATLERFAGGGQSVGDSYTDHWGCGDGATAPTSGSFIRIQAGPTDLADNVANASYPTNLSEYVEFASAFRGGVSGVMPQDGGGGAGGIGGAFNNPEISHYGITSFGKGNNNGDGGHGISLPNTRNYPTTSTSPQPQTILSNSLQNSWWRNPIADGSESVTDVAGGRAGSSGSNGIGVNGYGGGNNQSGVVTISYPYRPAYRFVTAQDFS